MFSFTKSTAMRRMLMARERIAKRNPFFASILFAAKMIETKDRNTIGTNGLDIYFNPDFVTAADNDKFIEGLVLKSVMHCAMLHLHRRRWREMRQWNDSCSYPVNQMVSEYFPLAPDALKHQKYGQMAPEAVYELLDKQSQQKPKPQSGKGKGKGQGQGQKGKGQQGEQERPGDMFDGGETEQERQDGEREWKRTLSNAIEKTKQAGTMPGSLKRLIDELKPQEKLDWKDLIRDMSRNAKSNTTRTWQRPNRRRLGGDEYIPGNAVDKVYKLVMALDVSGSVSQEMIKEMTGEAASLLDQNLVNHVTMVSVDTRIHSTLEAKTSEDLKGWNAGGGGGTDFRTAMDDIGKMEDVIGLIFLTDMYTSSFGKEPPFPVVWVDWAGGGSKAPFGRTVPYK